MGLALIALVVCKLFSRDYTQRGMHLLTCNYVLLGCHLAVLPDEI